ncbi:MAG: winged helix DNA-binding domain-containing protein [Notoacmeibacter sp.]|nr:winged helix DNA-binding domain-containing protein [Notoacmeibacter sp.]
MRKVTTITKKQARRAWIAAQRLDTDEPFGSGPDAVRRAVEHLGYVQIDTINVIERCHHHILFNRIPAYRRGDLHHAQGVDKSVFEYWTHALSYIPARDFRYFLPAMKAHRANPNKWFGNVTPGQLRRVMKLVREKGPLSIRDIEERRLVEKDHEWASRKPSKRALELAFFDGRLTIAARDGMVKAYELTERHFGWNKPPRPATDRQIVDYLIDRALRSQAVVSLDSVCHLDAGRKPAIRDAIERRVRARKLKPVRIENEGATEHWVEPALLDRMPGDSDPARIHILSPFDPLVIQRKRATALLGYDHVFEAYVPAAKRRFGYFTLPVLAGDEIVAAIDLKADRQAKALLIQAWHWVGTGNETEHRRAVEAALDRFERFQFQEP